MRITMVDVFSPIAKGGIVPPIGLALRLLLCFIGLMFHSLTVFAAYPLITDDSGTQGSRGFQIEVNGMLGFDTEKRTRERYHEIATNLSYGVSEDLDFVLAVPYQRFRITRDDGTLKNGGIADISLELKWRFYQVAGLSLAFKPGVTFPTSSHKKGLGTGKSTYGTIFIVTKEIAPWTFHANVAYRKNENRLSERRDIWHTSIASEFEVFQGLKLVANIGIERNKDGTSNIHPGFFTGGIIYSLSKTVDINCGIQFGINKTETDYTFRPGIVYRFNFQ